MTRERLRLQITEHPLGTEGFHLLPRRWVIERTFAWLDRNRRLARDFERLIGPRPRWPFSPSSSCSPVEWQISPDGI